MSNLSSKEVIKYSCTKPNRIVFYFQNIFDYPPGESPAELLAQLSTQRALIKEQETRIEALVKRVAELNDILAKAQKEAMDLRLKNKELVEKLNKYEKSDSSDS